jgi:CubicO group peptidase (beta-lactamase class C family)
MSLLRTSSSQLLRFVCPLVLLFALIMVESSSTTIQAALVLPTPASSTSDLPLPDASVAQIETYLNQLARSGRLSGAVLVAHNGRVLRKAYHLADRETGDANTPRTMFRIGSISKQFTALAILILQERKKLQVQDHICLYIPACPTNWRAITIQHLLTHTSGIPDYTDAPDFLSWWDKPATPEQIIARFKGLPLHFEPGSQFRYSNSGYLLLGYVIEQLSGQSYATFLDENIFIPLKMMHSGYDTSVMRPGHAQGYLNGYRPVDKFDISWAHAAGALYSTVEDLYTWDLALAAHRLVSPQALDDMFTIHIPCAPPGSPKNCLLPNDLGYGYGWFIAQEPQGKLMYHVGHIDGFFSFNGFYPEKNIQVVVLTNLENIDVLGVGRDLAAMV